MAVRFSRLGRWAAAAAVAGTLHAAVAARSEAEDFCRPGYAQYCENAHADDARSEDCEDGWGIMSFWRDWHDEYFRHKRDKRRHLYYKAQNAHYDLFYPRCPPDWSMTHGYHATQWRPFPGECDPRLMWPSQPLMSPSGAPGMLPTPADPATTPPVVPPAASGNPPQPYSPPPVEGDEPPAPPAEPATEPVIQLMNSDRARIEAIELLPPGEVSLKPSGIILLESTGDDWVPTQPH